MRVNVSVEEDHNWTKIERREFCQTLVITAEEPDLLRHVSNLPSMTSLLLLMLISHKTHKRILTQGPAMPTTNSHHSSQQQNSPHRPFHSAHHPLCTSPINIPQALQLRDKSFTFHREKEELFSTSVPHYSSHRRCFFRHCMGLVTSGTAWV